MFMRTQRLFLRPIFPEDWRGIYRGIADYGVVSMLATAPWPYRPADAIAFSRKSPPTSAMKFVITLPELSGAPVIGMMGLDRQDDGSHELGYWIARSHQRRGYASEAARGVVSMADALGVQSIEAGHYLENPASGKVLRAAGLVETGDIRPSACLARGGEMVLSRRYRRLNPAFAENRADCAA